jgi:hypothetical protein
VKAVDITDVKSGNGGAHGYAPGSATDIQTQTINVTVINDHINQQTKT